MSIEGSLVSCGEVSGRITGLQRANVDFLTSSTFRKTVGRETTIGV